MKSAILLARTLRFMFPISCSQRTRQGCHLFELIASDAEITRVSLPKTTLVVTNFSSWLSYDLCRGTGVVHEIFGSLQAQLLILDADQRAIQPGGDPPRKPICLLLAEINLSYQMYVTFCRILFSHTSTCLQSTEEYRLHLRSHLVLDITSCA